LFLGSLLQALVLGCEKREKEGEKEGEGEILLVLFLEEAPEERSHKART
jgi:hypothetical protein